MGEDDALEYEVKFLGHYEAKGTLSLHPDTVTFLPEMDYLGKIEIPVAKITDARFATEKDISALRVWLVGPVLGTLWKQYHTMLTIDAEDEFGILQHFVFEGKRVEEIMDELYEIRKRKKMASRMQQEGQTQPSSKTTTTEEPTLTVLKNGTWKCPKCFRTNSRRAKFCTRCGNERK